MPSASRRCTRERAPSTSAEAAVQGADVVALATHAAQPVIEPAWIAPGTHVSSVGYRPPDGELPRALAREQRLFVETREAFEPTPVGCAELSRPDPDTATEIGEVLLGRAPGRTNAAEITVYKAMGHVVEDIAAAELVYTPRRAAQAREQPSRYDGQAARLRSLAMNLSSPSRAVRPTFLRSIGVQPSSSPLRPSA